jgi:hypothetical protein
MPTKPDQEVLRAFIKVLKVQTLVNGNFYTQEGIRITISHCLVRLGLVQPACMQQHCPKENDTAVSPHRSAMVTSRYEVQA